MSLKIIWFAIPIITVLVGLLVSLDGKRLTRHIQVAQDLIAKGVAEPEAMQHSGCNHWDRPFMVRIWKAYPKLPNEY